MRRRRKHLLVPALLASALVHAIAFFPVRAWFREHLAVGNAQPAPPVKMVRLSPEAWKDALAKAHQAQRKRPRTDPAKADGQAPVPRQEPEPKPEPKKDEPKLDGQVVDVPATRDDSDNPDAKYLGKYNSNVDKESVARLDDRDPNKRRVTHKLQDKTPNARPDTPKAPGLELRSPSQGGGTGGAADDAREPGQGKAEAGGAKRFALEVPDLRRQDDLNLRLSKLPDFRQALRNQRGRDEIRGNSDRFKMELGDRNGDSDTDGDAQGGGAGSRGLPNLDALRPRLGTVGRVSGSPSSDYVENVPEGDGTFLNTREFKYATFFIRVKDGVESHWRSLIRQEYRRRDPTGQVYGSRNRSTVLRVVLDDSGRLDSVRVAESCGLDFLDQAAMEAFRRAGHFPNPPDGILEADGTVQFNFQFVVVLRNSGLGGLPF